MQTDLNEKTALVIGATGALGTAVCRQLAGSGARVAGDYQDPELARACRDELARDQVLVELYAADLADLTGCADLVAAVERDLGPIDIVVNALDFEQPARFRDMDKSQWDRTLGVNLDNVFNICRQVVAGMGSRGYGRIVNIASVISRQGEAGHSHYAAAKAGVHGFTMALAQELARNGVTVNTVSPGYLDEHLPQSLTEEQRQALIARIPAARLGRADELACLVDFLCSDQAGFITGADIAINGGQYMH